MTRKGQEMWGQKRIRRKRQKPSERCIGDNLVSLKWGFFVQFSLEFFFQIGQIALWWV